MRSSSTQLAQRINGALLLLRRLRSGTKAVAALVRQYRISRRQALRYVRQAQSVGRMQPIPERKVVFTVKLPLRLVRALRHMARSTGESLSALVTRALEAFLQNRGGHG
jgi:predicted HicB family RNase H-like nuclease